MDYKDYAEEYYDCIDKLKRRSFLTVINALYNIDVRFPELGLRSEIESIDDSYAMMMKYWADGIDDPHLNSVSESLINRMYRMLSDFRIHINCKYIPQFANAYTVGKKHEYDELFAMLEKTLADQVLLELAPHQERESRAKTLSETYFNTLEMLFSKIWTSTTWNQALADDMEHRLLGGMLDSVACQTIVSALMLSLQCVFDPRKFRLLVNIYRKSTDNDVRQRALVAWALTLRNDLADLFPEIKAIVDNVVDDEETCNELVELNMQLFFCSRAVADNSVIQKEIMPDIINNSNIRATTDGIIEEEEDELENILHPEAQEEKMERLEESVERMKNMIKEGVDIYYGGFARTKVLPFFSRAINWFIPFYDNHPQVRDIMNNDDYRPFLSTILNHGAFCDSDKYSFLLAFSQIIRRVPESILGMMKSGELRDAMDFMPDDNSASYVRRMYVQSLYRFFMLYSGRQLLDSPFEMKDWQSSIDLGTSELPCEILANSMLHSTRMESRMTEMAAFYVKKGALEYADRVLNNVSREQQGYNYWILKGKIGENYWMQSHKKGQDLRPWPLESYSRAESLADTHPDVPATAAIARLSFAAGYYDRALEAFTELLGVKETRNRLLGWCASLVNLGRESEALNTLFKLNLENPERDDINRVLARALTATGKYRQAHKLYEKLCSGDGADKTDWLNHAFCYWAEGNRRKAAECLYKSLGTTHDDDASEDDFSRVQSLLYPEIEFLDRLGIGSDERKLMSDAVALVTSKKI